MAAQGVHNDTNDKLDFCAQIIDVLRLILTNLFFRTGPIKPFGRRTAIREFENDTVNKVTLVKEEEYKKEFISRNYTKNVEYINYSFLVDRILCGSFCDSVIRRLKTTLVYTARGVIDKYEFRALGGSPIIEKL
ncbi:hypothetical protein TcasGA2_TC003661 [Tribolium castaneum]|uniref:Uncharacterized protein n=1 Tax=Tribolium castaneum TaxID=7070 RepID=D6WDH3_TRICA|nr:hypothetical protein TcasGA2_TC003661 [Tribolium castaneum]